jgi:hypothetical protein
VRDETTGVVRAFVKVMPMVDLDFSEMQPSGKRAVLVDDGGGDRVVMHEPARIERCSTCDERDVFGAPMRDGATLCAQCITLDDIAGGGVDADFARALARLELATAERPALRALLARLDGAPSPAGPSPAGPSPAGPWSFLAEMFAQAAWGFDDALYARRALLERAWRRAIDDEPGTIVDIIDFGAPENHPWLGGRNKLRFTVNATTITAHNGDVVAVRS